jgi:SAM-dependent methyltransferase
VNELGPRADEVAFYERQTAAKFADARSNPEGRDIMRIRARGHAIADHFPDPRDVWINSLHELHPDYAAYRFLSPVVGKRVMQLGGGGFHAVKFLLAGAAQAHVVSPVRGELDYAATLAEVAGVSDRLSTTLGIGEDLPLGTASLDAIYAPGTLHHMDVERALHEIDRVLVTRGRFAAVDPWRAPGYQLGIRIFGKREPEVLCRPLILSRFGTWTNRSGLVIKRFGPLLRYPVLAISHLGADLSARQRRRLADADERLAQLIPALRRFGSCSLVTYEKLEESSPAF